MVKSSGDVVLVIADNADIKKISSSSTIMIIYAFLFSKLCVSR